VTEVWTASVNRPGFGLADGIEAERAGFDGVSFGDTQHLSADPYCGLAVVARATERLRLMVGVTNPGTRHPAVTAAAIATVQVESGGRAVLGLGRGDSALAYIGLPPVSVKEFVDYTDRVQGYLRGEVVETGGFPSEIPWIAASGLPKVPVDVAATGPKMIGYGACFAERLTVNMGAEPERVAWALEVARAAREAAGVTTPLALGAYLVVAAHDDRATARDLARACLGVYARFSGLPGGTAELLTPEDKLVVDAVTADYDRNYGRGWGRHVNHLDEDFVDRFGVVGTPAECLARLKELVALGLDHLVLVEGRDANRPEGWGESHAALAAEVLPGLRS